MSRGELFSTMAAAKRWRLERLQGLCEKRIEAAICAESVPLVLRRASEGGFLFLKRQCLQWSLDHYAALTESNAMTLAVVSELRDFPHVVAELLGLARQVRARRTGGPPRCRDERARAFARASSLL